MIWDFSNSYNITKIISFLSIYLIVLGVDCTVCFVKVHPDCESNNKSSSLAKLFWMGSYRLLKCMYVYSLQYISNQDVQMRETM